MLNNIRWTRIIAIGLGVLLALWLLRGDARPEATELDTEFTVTVTKYYVADGVDYFRVTDGVAAGILTVDDDVPLATWLKAHKKVTLR